VVISLSVICGMLWIARVVYDVSIAESARRKYRAGLISLSEYLCIVFCFKRLPKKAKEPGENKYDDEHDSKMNAGEHRDVANVVFGRSKFARRRDERAKETANRSKKHDDKQLVCISSHGISSPRQFHDEYDKERDVLYRTPDTMQMADDVHDHTENEDAKSTDHVSGNAFRPANLYRPANVKPPRKSREGSSFRRKHSCVGLVMVFRKTKQSSRLSVRVQVLLQNGKENLHSTSPHHPRNAAVQRGIWVQFAARH